MNKKIIGYKAVHSFDHEALSYDVAKHIKEGWQPFGSIAVCTYIETDSDGDEEIVVEYIQPMVKYADE